MHRACIRLKEHFVHTELLQLVQNKFAAVEAIYAEAHYTGIQK